MPKVIRDYERGGHIPTDLQPSLAALFGVSVAHLMGWDAAASPQLTVGLAR